MLKIDFLKRVALIGLAAPLAALEVAAKADAEDDEDVLVGLWEGVVRAGGTTYRYIWSMSRGSYIATGDIDENFMGFKYSPTMGAYKRNADGSYRFHERGYAFDLKGNNVGTFTTLGTFQLDAGRETFSGPGTFTQFDLKSKPVARESLTVTAKRIAV